MQTRCYPNGCTAVVSNMTSASPTHSAFCSCWLAQAVDHAAPTPRDIRWSDAKGSWELRCRLTVSELVKLRNFACYTLKHRTGVHSQVISCTFYPGRTVVLLHGRVRRQGAGRAHLPGGFGSPRGWAEQPLTRTLTRASCFTWPTTSRWAVVNGSDPLQWGQSDVWTTAVKQQRDSLLLCGTGANQRYAGIRGERWWWWWWWWYNICGTWDLGVVRLQATSQW